MNYCAIQVLLLHLSIVLQCWADEAPFLQSLEYNAGSYGKYPTQSFNSSDVVAPILNFNKPFTNCDDGSYLFISPRGDAADSAPVILDASGSLVWTAELDYGELYNLQVQQYVGEPHLTFWAGDSGVGGHGIGKYYMMNQQYEVVREITAANGFGADLHVFTVVPRGEMRDHGTALISIYERKHVDLSSVSSWFSKGWIWDSIFQEIDLETGEAIFEWRASEQVKLTESYTKLNFATRGNPWDFFHINAVEKDPAGNYMVSSRHLRSILYVDGITGNIMWQIGGKSNSFEDLSDGAATQFVGQHDAHWADERHTAITIFDNGADWFDRGASESRGVRVSIDLQAMTARLDTAFVHPGEHILSATQGSYQTLPNGHVLLGYGINGVMTEYSADGEMLCDAFFEPAKYFTTDNVQSYKALKFNWTGLPQTMPSLVGDGGAFYVSWLGATEVSTWVLQDSESVDGPYDDVCELPKAGFETEIVPEMYNDLGQYVRVIGLNLNGDVLGTSSAVDLDAPASQESTQESEEFQRDLLVLLGLATLAASSIFLVYRLSTGSGPSWLRIPNRYTHEGAHESQQRQGSTARRYASLRLVLALTTRSITAIRRRVRLRDRDLECEQRLTALNPACDQDLETPP